MTMLCPGIGWREQKRPWATPRRPRRRTPNFSDSEGTPVSTSHPRLYSRLIRSRSRKSTPAQHSESPYVLGESDHRNRKSCQLHGIATQLRARGWLEACGLIHVLDLSTAGSRDRYLEGTIPLVHQQYAALASARQKRERVHKRLIRRSVQFHQLVTRAKVVVEELEHPEPGVGLTVVPIDHGNAGKLRWKPHQLRLARHVNPDLGHLAEQVSVQRPSQIPVGVFDRLGDVTGLVLR